MATSLSRLELCLAETGLLVWEPWSNDLSDSASSQASHQAFWPHPVAALRERGSA